MTWHKLFFILKKELFKINYNRDPKKEQKAHYLICGYRIITAINARMQISKSDIYILWMRL
jgi:membrane-anchored glycerophosphoryl diester phosphodiesterase (GDPDase)